MQHPYTPATTFTLPKEIVLKMRFEACQGLENEGEHLDRAVPTVMEHLHALGQQTKTAEQLGQALVEIVMQSVKRQVLPPRDIPLMYDVLIRFAKAIIPGDTYYAYRQQVLEILRSYRPAAVVERGNPQIR